LKADLPFPKGHVPWNKGKTDVYSEEVIKIMSDSAKLRSGEKGSFWGKKHSEETRRKISEGRNKGLSAGSIVPWNRNKIISQKLSRQALHAWVRRNLPMPLVCQKCNTALPYDVANVSPTYNPETYVPDINNWVWMCRKCHLLSDGRLEKQIEFFRQYNATHVPWNKK
jgi:hypothetical protein